MILGCALIGEGFVVSSEDKTQYSIKMVTPAAPKAVVQLVIDLRENELISQELIAEVLLDLLEDRQHQAALLSISQILQAVALITNPVLENSETATNVDTLKGFTKVGVERISSILDSLPDWIKADKSEACGGEVTCLVVTASCLALDAMASQSPSEQTLICSKDAAAKLLKCCELHGLDKASEQKMDMWKALIGSCSSVFWDYFWSVQELYNTSSA